MKKRILIIILVILMLISVTGGLLVFGVNAYVKGSSRDYIITPEQAVALNDVDCIIVPIGDKPSVICVRCLQDVRILQP